MRLTSGGDRWPVHSIGVGRLINLGSGKIRYVSMKNLTLGSSAAADGRLRVSFVLEPCDVNVKSGVNVTLKRLPTTDAEGDTREWRAAEQGPSGTAPPSSPAGRPRHRPRQGLWRGRSPSSTPSTVSTSPSIVGCTPRSWDRQSWASPPCCTASPVSTPLTAGHVFLGDVELSALNDNELTQLRRDHIRVVFQSYNLIPTLTAFENITLPLTLAGRSPDKGWLDHIIDIVGLRSRLTHRPSELSGGQQRRHRSRRACPGEPTRDRVRRRTDRQPRLERLR